MTIFNRYAQDEVLKILSQNGLTQTQLADYLGCTVQVLNYQLNIAKHFDADMERMIYKFFAKQGITKNQEGEIKMISNQIIEHAALNNHQLAILTKTVQDIIKDDRVTDEERAKALSTIRSYRSEVNDSLNALESLVNGAKEIHLIQKMTR